MCLRDFINYCLKYNLCFGELPHLTFLVLVLPCNKEEKKFRSLLPLIFQDIQTNSPCDGTNIRMPYFSDKPDLEYKAHLSF